MEKLEIVYNICLLIIGVVFITFISLLFIFIFTYHIDSYNTFCKSQNLSHYTDSRNIYTLNLECDNKVVYTNLDTKYVCITTDKWDKCLTSKLLVFKTKNTKILKE